MNLEGQRYSHRPRGELSTLYITPVIIIPVNEWMMVGYTRNMNENDEKYRILDQKY